MHDRIADEDHFHNVVERDPGAPGHLFRQR